MTWLDIDACSWPWVVKGVSGVVSDVAASVDSFYDYDERYLQNPPKLTSFDLRIWTNLFLKNSILVL